MAVLSPATYPKFPGKSALSDPTPCRTGGEFSSKMGTAGASRRAGFSGQRRVPKRAYRRGCRRDNTGYATKPRRAQGEIGKKGGAVNRRGHHECSVNLMPILLAPRRKASRTLGSGWARAKRIGSRVRKLRWKCEIGIVNQGEDKTPEEAVLHFPGGMSDFLQG